MWQRWNQSTHIFEKSTDNGGSWTPLGLDASIITEGTLPDARLSSNVALHNGGSHGWSGNHNITSTGPRIWFTDSLQPANNKVFTLINLSGALKIIASDDAFNDQVVAFSVDRAGTVRAYNAYFLGNRTVAEGFWQDVPFNAANFFGSAGATWTVGAPAVVRNRCTFIGRTVLWSMYISWFSGSNVVGGAGNTLNINVPLGLATSGNQMQNIDYCQVAGTPINGLYASIGGASISISKIDSSNFAAGSAPGMIFTIAYEIQ